MYAKLLHTPTVEAELSKDDVVAYIADITSGTEPGKELLNQLGVVAIPLLVVYGPAIDAPLLADNWTPDSVVEMIRKARGGSGTQTPP